MAFTLQSWPVAGAPVGRRRDLAIAAVIAALALLLPFHRGLAFPFALDDYTFLFSAAGLEPATLSVRRWLTVTGYYTLWLRLFGPNPLAWHVTSFVLHVANSLWVYAFARRFGASRDAGWIACGLFAASPLAFTALYWAACIQEIASSFFVFAALWTLLRADRWRWASVGLFALAMLCKESVIAVPLVALLLFGRRARGPASAMFAVGAVLFVAAGLQHRMFDSNLSSPYATSYGTTPLVNLATQLVWFLAPWRAYPDRIAGPQAGLVLPAAAVVGAVAVLLLLTRGRYLGPLLAASAWFVAVLVPVLPLRQHSYAYYSYAAQVGFLIVGAVAWLGLVARLGGATTPWRLAFGAVAVAASILFATRNARTHETLMLANSLVPHDSVVRYAEAAGALVAVIRDLPPGSRKVAFMNFPQELGTPAHTPGDKQPGMVRVRRFPLRDSLRDGKLVQLVRPDLTGAWVDTLSADFEGPGTALFFTSGFNTIAPIPDLASAYVLEAQGRLLIDDRAGARRDLERALAVDPGFAAARVLLAGLETETANLARARELLTGLDPATVPAELRAYVAQLRQVLGLEPPAASPPSP